MIPATHIAIDADTAWWVVPPPGTQGAPGNVNATIAGMLDRPCDRCDGDMVDGSHEAALYYAYSGKITTCDDCDNTGRHTFTVDVAGCAHSMVDPCGDCGEVGIIPHRVSVVPGMVLPIVNYDDWQLHDEHPSCVVINYIFAAKRHDILMGATRCGGATGEDITMPPAAAPGMWAVQLNIH
jgi:hypothetical protein